MTKQLTLAFAAVAGFLLLPACTTVVEKEPTVHSTTTTETTTRRPVTGTTVESTSVRSY